VDPVAAVDVQIIRFEDFGALAGIPHADGLARSDPVQLAAHRTDAHLVALAGGAAVGRCSLWWRETPPHAAGPLGVIGHFAAAPGADLRPLLLRACKELAGAGAVLAVGPMDGNTWRSYRLVTGSGGEPPFFLEPWTPAEWPAHFLGAGFTPLATYHSSVAEDLSEVDPRVAEAGERLRANDIRVRTLDARRYEEELGRIHALSVEGFSRNFLYTPIGREEFVAQYRPVQRFLDPGLVFIAERGGDIAGFLFAVPDVLESQRGSAPRTVIVKTVAVRPGRACGGLGAWLTAECHARAAQAGFTRAVHALMHDSNNSVNISRRYSRVLRRYTLYARRLVA
jgi:hypothetical protein